jgi:hypothetical protein
MQQQLPDPAWICHASSSDIQAPQIHFLLRHLAATSSCKLPHQLALVLLSPSLYVHLDEGCYPVLLSHVSRRYQQAELQNGRWAMMGAAGILVPDLFHSVGLGGPAAQIPWFEAGKYEYFAPPSALFASMMFLFAFVEFRR